MNKVFKEGQMVIYGGRKVEVMQVRFINGVQYVKFQKPGGKPFVVQF